MKCQNCRTDNETGAKFCNECGARLESACPECGKTNRPGSKFCNECGHNPTLPSEPPPKDLSFDEKLDKIQRYLPKGLSVQQCRCQTYKVDKCVSVVHKD